MKKEVANAIRRKAREKNSVQTFPFYGSIECEFEVQGKISDTRKSNTRKDI